MGNSSFWYYESSTRTIADKIARLESDVNKIDKNSNTFRTLAKHFTEGILNTLKSPGLYWSNEIDKYGSIFTVNNDTPSLKIAITEQLETISSLKTNLQTTKTQYDELCTENGNLRKEIEQLKLQVKEAAINSEAAQDLKFWMQRCEELSQGAYAQSQFINHIQSQHI